MASTPQQVAQIIAQNRQRKAMALADALQASNFTLEMVRNLDPHGWHIVAAKAGTKPPSEDTQLLVIEILAHRERN